MSAMVASVSFCTSVSCRLRSSSPKTPFFSSVFNPSIPSRRTLRTAIFAFSAYWPASFANSLRRSSVRSGIGSRIIWPSTIGFSPSPAERIALSTGPTLVLSQTCTDSIRGSGADTVAT